jgi:hypothetical protein
VHGASSAEGRRRQRGGRHWRRDAAPSEASVTALASLSTCLPRSLTTGDSARLPGSWAKSARCCDVTATKRRHQSAGTGCFRRRLELTAYWPRCRWVSTFGCTTVVRKASQSAGLSCPSSETTSKRSRAFPYVLRWTGWTWRKGYSSLNSTGMLVRVNRTFVNSGPNHLSVSIMPS